ncbi:MAG: hypothetical protein GY776_15910 [Alteromonas sp.]|nr:hypothetical protein [Alteromonas sp.]
MDVRLRFIEAMLLTKQRLTRQHIVDRFGTSLPSATRDIKRYREMVTVEAKGKGELSTYVLKSAHAFHWSVAPRDWLKHLEIVYEHTDKSIIDATGGKNLSRA